MTARLALRRGTTTRRRSHAQSLPKKAAGFTLIEIGIVVGLLGLIAILVADFYTNQLSLRHAAQRTDGAVRDAQSIIDASVAWAGAQGSWPNDAPTLDTAGIIAIDQLVEDGYLSAVPRNRFADCPDGCGEYELDGWDRDVDGPDGTKGGYTGEAADAEDLILRFRVWGAGNAWSIASQLPQGEATPVSSSEEESEHYEVEARIAKDGFADRFVRLRNEGRAVVFAAAPREAPPADGEDGAGEDSPPPPEWWLDAAGDLQRVARITAGPRECTPNDDDCRRRLAEALEEGERNPEATGATIVLDIGGVTVKGGELFFVKQPNPDGDAEGTPLPLWETITSNETILATT